jgi:hypothetical protein
LISWPEVQAHANGFSAEWKDETRERANKDSFWDEFFQVFGIRRRSVAVYEQHAQRASTGRGGFMDVFWPGVIAVEHKSGGEDLDEALGQAMDYLPGLPPEHHPRLVVVSDFARMIVRDLDAGTTVEFPLVDLAANVQRFALLTGRTRRRAADVTEVEVNLSATELLRNLHDSLKMSGYDGHPLRVLLVRVLFALFADDTEVWEKDLFHFWLLDKTRQDGSDLGPALSHLWQVLNTDTTARSKHLDDDLQGFTYINGGLFAETLPIPDFTRDMRESLIECCLFDWGAISPAIFGSLFQEVMTPLERRQIGAHYTTEENILRTIEPLFLTELKNALDAATTRPALERFRSRLASLRFFDPACGCGNFLVIAYREIRRLETECIRRLRAQDRRKVDQYIRAVTVDSQVRLGQFYGIEIEEFPVRIAETAMYLIDHLENRALGREFRGYYVRFPISDTAHITHANALQRPWNTVLPAAECDFLFGNPPFVGMSRMDTEQQSDNRRVFSTTKLTVPRSGRLDYVACWYAMAADYMTGHPHMRAAFVSTNSITQGEQARSLGPALLTAGFHLDFAHRTFEWTSEARGRSHVHVVIIGLSYGNHARQPVHYDYEAPRSAPIERAVRNINWYLSDGPNLFPDKRYHPLVAHVPPVATKGSQPTDGGNLIVELDELEEVRADHVAARYLRRFVQGAEFLYGEDRWCLWLVGASSGDLRFSPVLRRRLARVRAWRKTSKTASVRAMADQPALFTQIRQPTRQYLALPEVSSANRRIIPGAFLGPDVIAGNKLITVPGANLWLFGVLQSSMFMAWVRTISGRLTSRFGLAVGLVYYSFPFPEADARSRRGVEQAAQAVLDARAARPEPLADLYGPSLDRDLARAHDNLDRAVTAAYGKRRPRTDADRLAVLFERYAILTGSTRLFEDEMLAPGAIFVPGQRDPQ